MFLNLSTVCTCVLIIIGACISAPVLIKGFTRRGKGVLYEKNFLIQRAPQYATLLNVILIVLSHLVGNNVVDYGTLNIAFSTAQLADNPVSEIVAGLGIVILVSGLIFMIGGWYSLGESFTTDAEVLEGHKIRTGGLLKFVMHPAYSGIIQSVLGSALAADSILSVAFCVFVVAPLWLNRAKYEESLLLVSLGDEYKNYAEKMGWRRLVPKFIPIGV